jgi:D-beta-D-heptose 7-phosphate kinase/D-beta-D-heptose 1-phosphate adenosyltransferase
MTSTTGRPVVVVGDALLDIDVEGRTERLCPDAPVPVLDVAREVPRPGGAGLAAALTAADGADVVLVSAVADDDEGRRLSGLLERAGVRLVPLRHDGSTPVKRRLRADGQSLLRLDAGSPRPPAAPSPEALAVIESAGAVLVSDYGRGVAAQVDVRRALAAAARRVPVVWDPHPRGATPLAAVRLVTPNHAEADAFAERLGIEALGLDGLARISARAAGLVKAWRVHGVSVTLGAGGALLSQGESSPAVLPARRVEARDVCGAGDRFASAATQALATGALTTEAVQAAVLAASSFVADGAAAALGQPAQDRRGELVGMDLVQRVRAGGGTVVATGGCFDLLHAGHVATVEAARALGDCLVVCLNSDASVRRLKGASRPLVPQADRARVLAALESVDAVVVFEEDTPVQALRTIRPHVWVKGGDYAGTDLPEASLLREWGGQSVVVPYLEGRSTTRLVTAVAERSGAGR